MAQVVLPTRQYSLIFCRRANCSSGEPEILLGEKKRGYGEGKLNGFGGKVEAGETISEGARRELEEEAGIVALDLTRRGSLVFEMSDRVMLVEVFECLQWTGEIVETEEMKPQWMLESQLTEIYDTRTWADDKYWLPLFLKGESFSGSFKYNEDDATINTFIVEKENPHE